MPNVWQKLVCFWFSVTCDISHDSVFTQSIGTVSYYNFAVVCKLNYCTRATYLQGTKDDTKGLVKTVIYAL